MGVAATLASQQPALPCSRRKPRPLFGKRSEPFAKGIKRCENRTDPFGNRTAQRPVNRGQCARGAAGAAGRPGSDWSPYKETRGIVSGGKSTLSVVCMFWFWHIANLRFTASATRPKKKRAEARLFQLDNCSAARIALGRTEIILGFAYAALYLADILLDIAFQLLRTITRQLASGFLDRTLDFMTHAFSALVVHGVFSQSTPQECDA